jgi:hypothetical protein
MWMIHRHDEPSTDPWYQVGLAATHLVGEGALTRLWNARTGRYAGLGADFTRSPVRRLAAGGCSPPEPVVEVAHRRRGRPRDAAQLVERLVAFLMQVLDRRIGVGHAAGEHPAVDCARLSVQGP